MLYPGVLYPGVLYPGVLYQGGHQRTGDVGQESVVQGLGGYRLEYDNEGYESWPYR